MFEVADLAVASPATVSRCGMVYLEPSILGLKPFYNCWLNDLCPNLQPHKETFRKLFETFLEVCVRIISMKIAVFSKYLFYFHSNIFEVYKQP